MTLGEHLRELRVRVLRAVIALALAVGASLFVWKPIWAFARRPFDEAVRRAGDAAAKLQQISPGEGFLQLMKLCLLSALVVTSPYVLWQLWGFVSAGLYKHERRAVRLFFPVSVGLFLLGVLTAYLVLIPFALAFLLGVGQDMGLSNDFRVGDYISLCLTMLLAMGLCFELPLVMLFLQATGLVQGPTFRKGWRVAVVTAFALAMIVTPDPSPTSMVLLALPLTGLYFLGIWAGNFVGENRQTFRLWKAWPLLLGALLFAALLLWSDRLTDLAHRLFGPDSAPSAPPG
jgi:sec-independent protein translocase protein TatC